MIAFEFEAGSGTASRIVSWPRQGEARHYAVGSFVQANFGPRRNFTIRGRRVGAALTEPCMVEKTERKENGSIIAVVATDASLLPHQLKRLSRRIPLGVSWTAGIGYHSSRDIFLAF